MKRLTILSSALVLCAVSTIAAAQTRPAAHATAFGKVYHASRTLDAALKVGVTQPHYRELVETMATELLLTQDHITTTRQKLLWLMFDDTLAAHQLALAMWPAPEILDTINPVACYKLYQTNTVAADDEKSAGDIRVFVNKKLR